MTSARRPTPYRPRRDPRELIIAVCAVVAVLVVTGVLLYVLKPADEDTPTPVPIPTPTAVPGTTVSGSPETSVPATDVPATVPATAPPGG